MQVASKVENLPFKFEFVSRIIRYVRDGRTDRQTDGRRTKATLIAPSLQFGA